MRLVRTSEGGVHEGLEDAELILRSSRDPELFGLLFERHAEPMLGFFARRTLDAESAAELVAETFAEAFASRFRFRDEGVDGAGWLYGIGKHLLSRYFRAGAVEARARRRLGMPERTVSDDDYERIEELIDFEGFGEALAEAMSSLPEEQREAVRLRAVDGRSYAEVAAELGCTEPTARMRVSRGLRRIAALIETDPSEAPIELERRRWQRRSTT
jgi:RNA polymerase sigma factor (sigma-70 family)